MTKNFNMSWRIAFLIVYTCTLFIINLFLFGSLIPSGLWFWTAIIALLLSEFIAQPYFTSPRDSLSNSVAAISTVIPLFLEGNSLAGNEGYWFAFLILAGAVLIVSILAMILGQSEMPQSRRTGESLTRVVGLFGSPRFLFTLIFFLALWTFHTNREEIFFLSFTWTVIVLGRPLENGMRLYMRLRGIWDTVNTNDLVIGEVVSRRQPNLVTIKLSQENMPAIHSTVLIPLDSETGNIGIVLDNYRLADEIWSRIVTLEKTIKKADVRIWSPANIVIKLDDEDVPKEVSGSNKLDDKDISKEVSGNRMYIDRDKFIGSVIERSDVSTVYIELYFDGLEIFEGQLLEILVNNKPVLYQVINGVTASETLHEANRHGYIQIQARKLGSWNTTKHHFEQVSWTPNIYSSVYLVTESEKVDFDPDVIGYIPKTHFGIKTNLKDIVTHNTAILGVLGSGKTSLAVELILKMVNEGIKVWVIDITNQYEAVLKDYIDINKQAEADSKINNEIDGHTGDMDSNKAKGGNHIKFKSEIAQHISNFMEDESWCVRVFNPNNYNVTEQTSGVFNNNAGFGELTVTQITRIISEQLLEKLKHDIGDEARVCLVLEEAHSLVPEWNSVAHEGDGTATNGTARAILQGRKYGFGCLLITQRTANVTKSILNQCNTIFGLRVFDATGMGFLSNYIGSDYASLLSTLPERHCVVFGRGVNAQSPMLIKLNDQDVFKASYKLTAKCKSEEELQHDAKEQGTQSIDIDDAYNPHHEVEASNYPPSTVDDIPF